MKWLRIVQNVNKSFPFPQLVPVSVWRVFSMFTGFVLMFVAWEVNITYEYFMTPSMVGVLLNASG